MNAQGLIDTAMTSATGDNGQLLLDVDITLGNDRFAVDLGARLQKPSRAAERENFLASTRVVGQTELGLDAAYRAWSPGQGAI